MAQAAHDLSRMFQLICAVMREHKDHLSELDGAIGDADHGITMALGFSAVNSAIARLDVQLTLPSQILDTAATAFLDAVGASTGPLYASGLRKAARALQPEESLDRRGQIALIEAITLGIKERGKGQRGDKTMLDAWIPAMEAALQAAQHDLDLDAMWERIITDADAGAQSTGAMVAVRGRAARLGERSLGHIDPGAASAVLILNAMRATFTGR
ncbi:dihydroxyacetone kinase subunit DhaL [Rhizobium oryziradicis]|uniref:Dihydroxyacetone kinase subunit L n=1 Tax=Rhizobium oryziradicis TaxID=1867956 RepID=A0A1Q8ZWU9_9HYPH|nr:dihydroxyacetone kinase subunit DhaL [Rhizobium oryziradicis]OLP46378.1 dihydroxyacetone kinase subunit L [Rhizobium oryziradicis]